MKQCSNCFEVKPLTEFYVKRTDKYATHQSRCKSCNKEICYAWANRNKPKRLERYFERKEAQL